MLVVAAETVILVDLQRLFWLILGPIYIRQHASSLLFSTPWSSAYRLQLTFQYDDLQSVIVQSSVVVLCNMITATCYGVLNRL